MNNINEFVEYFMNKYDSLLTKISRKYLIPNRYSIDDIKQYIAEKITSILTNRDNDKDAITNPEGYFKSCLDYYGIEFQRMHGYIFDLPKRPRKNSVEEESAIKAYGFKYIGDMTIDESNSLNSELDLEPEDPGTKSEAWRQITSVLTPEETRVLECIYMQNLTWNETSKVLGVAQSTCWFRKNRAIAKIYDACIAMTGSNMIHNLRNLIRGNNDYTD